MNTNYQHFTSLEEAEIKRRLVKEYRAAMRKGLEVRRLCQQNSRFIGNDRPPLEVFQVHEPQEFLMGGQSMDQKLNCYLTLDEAVRFANRMTSRIADLNQWKREIFNNLVKNNAPLKARQWYTQVTSSFNTALSKLEIELAEFKDSLVNQYDILTRVDEMIICSIVFYEKVNRLEVILRQETDNMIHQLNELVGVNVLVVLPHANPASYQHIKQE